MVLAFKQMCAIEKNQTWLIWNIFTIATFQVNSPNVRAQKQRIKKFLKLVRGDEEKELQFQYPIIYTTVDNMMQL